MERDVQREAIRMMDFVNVNIQEIIFTRDIYIYTNIYFSIHFDISRNNLFCVFT